MSGARLNMSELIATCSALPQCNIAIESRTAVAAAAATQCATLLLLLQLPQLLSTSGCACVCTPVEARYGVRAFISTARKRAAEILTGNVANNIFNTPSLTNCTHRGRGRGRGGAITVYRSPMTNVRGAGIFSLEWELIE